MSLEGIPETVHRPRLLAQKLGVSIPTLYRWVAAGLLPSPRRIGPNTTGWLASEIDAWLRSRPVESCLDSEQVHKLQEWRQGAGGAA
jgi:prophage regulatory protein